MHFQPLEEITENLEESATRNHNLALFNRLLNSAPSPTNIVGGAFSQTSSQLQPLTRSISTDPSYSDGEEKEEERYVRQSEGAGGLLPSGLGNDTQCIICHGDGTSNTCIPLSAQELNPSQAINGEHEGYGLKKEENEEELTMLKIPPPLTRVLKQKKKPRLPASTKTNQSTPDDFQPIGARAKVITLQSSSGNTLSDMVLLTLPSFPEVTQWALEEQRQRSFSMGLDVNSLSNMAEE